MQPLDGDGVMQGILNRLAAVPTGSSSSSRSRALRPTLSSTDGSSSSGRNAGSHTPVPIEAFVPQQALHASNAPAVTAAAAAPSNPSYSNSNTLAAGRFAHGLGQLGASGNSFNAPGTSSSGSSIGSHSARLLTPGLAARAQMLLTRDLATSVTPRTPRGRMAELSGSAQPVSTGLLCIDSRPGSAGTAGVGTTTGTYYPAGHGSNAADLAALAQQQQAAARRSSLEQLLQMVSSKSNDLKLGAHDSNSSPVRSKAGQRVGHTNHGAGRGGPPSAAAAAAAAAQRSGLQLLGSPAGARSSA